MEVSAGQQHVQTVNVPGGPEEVVQQLTSQLAGVPGYTMTPTGPTSLVLTRRFMPQWALITGIIAGLLTCIGFLVLLVKEQETLTITAQPADGGTRLDVNGAISPAMRTRLTSVINALGGNVAATPGFAPAPAAPAPAPAAGSAPAPPPASAAASPAAWHPDPSGRHEQRYWDGAAWTDHVMDKGQPGNDPPPW
jgi:hypothetical protein